MLKTQGEEKKEKRVFLGGTCNESTWRGELTSMLEIDYFDPVVDDWTPECMEEEVRQRKQCDFVLYVITPLMKGVYSIAEVVDDSNKRPDKTVFCVLEKDVREFKIMKSTGIHSTSEEISFSKGQLKSLGQVKNMVKENGATVCESLNDVAEYLNGDK